jgi:diguanylate cyclase (GGDEF)-like protein
LNFENNLTINLYSVVLLIFIYFHAKKRAENSFMQHKLYITVLQATIITLVIDIFSRFDGHPGTIYYAINHVSNFLIFLLNPVIPTLWLLYVHFQISHEETFTKRLLYPLLAVNAVNMIMLVLSQFTRWYYYIDSNNIYHRGRFFWFPTLITVLLTLMALVLIVSNREKVEKKYYFALVFFPIPPFLCVILQFLFYGASLVLNGVALSLLIVFFDIQDHSMNTDYLTGVYNRKKLENYMKEKINTSTENRTFSAILIDLNNFKSINDTFGHDIGDSALEATVGLLRSCLRSIDFIARFGGDEFYIILDVSNRNDLETTVSRINKFVEKYNVYSNKPFKLGFSMGYAVYDYHSHMKLDEFQKQIDILMYENKRANKILEANKTRLENPDQYSGDY